MLKKRLFIIAGLIMITSLVYGVRDDDGFSEEKWLRAVESIDSKMFYSSNRNGSGFFNPWMPMEEKGLGEVIRWHFFSRKQKYSELEESWKPEVKPLTADFINTHDNFMTWIGHASVLIKASGSVFLVDPVLGDITFMIKRFTPAALDYEEASGITGSVIILLTHNHYDHLDKKSIRSMPQSARYIVPLGLGKIVKEMGAQNIDEIDWWNELNVNGIKVVFLPSQHWSKRMFDDANSSLWGSFLVDTGNKKIFICGDSGYSLVYREIAAKYRGIDYAFISAGTFHPRWFMHYAHQDDSEAIRGFKDLGAKTMIPFHWGAFRLGDEPPGYPAIHIKLKFPGARTVDCGGIIAL